MYLNNGLQVKIRGIYLGFFVLLAAFCVRIYGYLFGTPNRFIFEFTMLGVGVFALLSAIKLARLKNCAYNSLLNVSILFWIWTCISSVVNVRNFSGLVYDLVMQSFWFLFLMFFTYYSGYALPKDMSFVKKGSAIFMVGMGLVYLLWLFFGGDTLVSGALNTVYYSLLLLPVVFVLRNKLIMISSTVIVFLAVIVSGKRTAFIALALALFIPMLFFSGKRKHRLRRIILIIFLIVALFVAYYFITSVFEITLFDRLQELSDDAGSGRLEIYVRVQFDEI